MNLVANNDPWIVRESKAVELPPGSYFVEFLGTKDCTIKVNGEEKPKWRFVWRIKTGELAGKEPDTLTDRDISPDTQAGRLIAGLIGKAIKAGDNVKALVAACIGQSYIGICEKGKKDGKPCIRTVSKPPEGM